MRTGRWIVPLLALTVSVVWASASAAKAASGAKVYNWGFASQNSMSHAMGLAHQELFKEIKKRSDGRLNITYHAEGELPINQTEFIAACGQGLVEMAAGDVSAVGGSLTSGLLPAMPFLVAGYKEGHTAVDAIRSSIDADIEKYGAKFLFYTIYPLQQIWGSGAVPAKARDLSGRIIRSQGAEMSKALELFGAHPVSISGAEVPSSLSRGVINGGVTAGITVTATGWYPYIKWGYLVNMVALPSYICVNQKAFDELPQDLQKILVDTTLEYQENFYDTYVAGAEEEQWKILKEKYGITLVEMTGDDREMIMKEMRQYWYDYARSMGDDVVKDLEKILKALNIPE